LCNLIYLLIGLTTLMGAVFWYRIMQYKADIGGWWYLVFGRKPVQAQMWAHSGGSSGGGKENKRRYGEESVEDRIISLASALGMPSNELASAIASAVRSYVPPASRSSVAAKETGEAVKALFSEPEESQGDILDSSWLGDIVEGFVGSDEPLA
jgi:hypothetical protein